VSFVTADVHIFQGHPVINAVFYWLSQVEPLCKFQLPEHFPFDCGCEMGRRERQSRFSIWLVTAVFSVLHVPLVVCGLLINALARCPVGRCHRLKHRKSVTSFKLVADYATNPKP